MVWHDDEAVGLIDWDFLHHGPRLNDVAYALQWFTPARDDEMAITWHHFPTVPDRATRVRIFLQTYGGLQSFDFAETIATRMEAPVRKPWGFPGFRFPPEVILLAVRWYLRYGLSYRDLEELLAEGGIEVDHVTLYRWVQRFTPLLIDAARPVRHLAGDRWFVDETYVKDNGVWSYDYRAVDQHGQVIDVYLSRRRDIGSARMFFTAALSVHRDPGEVITDRAPGLANVVEELLPAAWHHTSQYENNRVECDHGRLKARLRPMRGVKTNRTASVVIRGHAFIQNLRRDHYELAVHAAPLSRLATAFDELRPAI